MKQIVALNTDLMRVAAEEYGDATCFWAIAAANNLDDYLIAGPIVLTIPDYDPSYAGGVPTQ